MGVNQKVEATAPKTWTVEDDTFLDDDEHEKDYWTLVHSNGTLKLKIDARTIIETRRYTRVQEIIDAMMNRNKQGVTFF